MNEQITVEPPLSRLQAKEAIRLAFVSGKARLVDLGEQFGVPYDTVMRWSSDEKWGEVKEITLQKADQKATEKVSQWIAEQREGQIRRAITRSLRAQTEIDRILDEGDVHVDSEGLMQRIPIGAKAIQSIVMSEERADLIIRRNLGMEDQGAGGMSVSLRVVGNCQVNAG